MGAKAWFVAYFNHDPRTVLAQKPELDRDACTSLARSLFPNENLEEQDDGNLDFLCPSKREVFIGVYGDLKIIAHNDLAIDLPSQIDSRWHDKELGSTAYVHATHSVVDWCAFALWEKGELVRALSVSPDGGIQEDIGNKLSFEAAYWDGSSMPKDEFDDDPYPLPFHPLELSESALLAMLGFQFEGHPDDWVCNPPEIPIMKFKMARNTWWKFWN